MTMVDLDNELYEKVKKFINKKENIYDFPTIKNYVERSVNNQLRIDMIGNKEREK